MVYPFTSLSSLLQSHLLSKVSPETLFLTATTTPDVPYPCPYFGFVLRAYHHPTYLIFQLSPLRKNLHEGGNFGLFVSLCLGQCLACSM